MFLRKHYKFAKPFLMFEEGDTLTERDDQWHVDDDSDGHCYGRNEVQAMVEQEIIVKYKPEVCKCSK